MHRWLWLGFRRLRLSGLRLIRLLFRRFGLSRVHTAKVTTISSFVLAQFTNPRMPSTTARYRSGLLVQLTELGSFESFVDTRLATQSVTFACLSRSVVDVSSAVLVIEYTTS